MYPQLTIEQLESKILSRIAKDTNGCWNWKGGKSAAGYGYWTEGAKKPMWRVHRLMWALTHNELMPRYKSAKVVIDHMCNNPSCFRPSHLQKITQKENVRRNPKHDSTHVDYHLSTHNHIEANEIVEYVKKKPYGHTYKRCTTCQRFKNHNPVAWRIQRDKDLMTGKRG